MHYNEELDKIDFYKIHPEYKPFIGNKYDEFKILHVGESHYISQKYDPLAQDYVSIADFKNWWNDSCYNLYIASNDYYNTKEVIESYLKGVRRKGHSIFTEVIKVFDRVYLCKDNVHIDYEESQNYHYFAFMNFFQMPALYHGKQFWDSLVASAKKQGDKTLAYDMYEKTAQRSTEVLDAVIEAIKPNVVIFTSRLARNAYDNHTGKYRLAPYVVTSTHPGCAWWNKPMRQYSGLTGKQELERILSELKIK